MRFDPGNDCLVAILIMTSIKALLMPEIQATSKTIQGEIVNSLRRN
jgi:hypothetical protein